MDNFNRQHGFAAVETVVVTPILILLFVIIVDVGRVMYHSLSTAAAARAAAAYGAQSTSFISDAVGMASIAKQDGVSLVRRRKTQIFLLLTAHNIVYV